MRDQKALIARIREILMNDWDPLHVKNIPGRPNDEYDFYIQGIQELIRTRQPVPIIRKHLKEMEVTHMGTRREDREIMVAAQKLFDLEGKSVAQI